MKYAVFNEDFTLMTCLVEGIHEIPSSAVALDADLFLKITQETDGVWGLGANGEITKQPFPEVAPDYPAMIASERYKREGVGITVDGSVIDTTRDGQALIAGAAVSAILDPAYRCNWKTAAGFIELNAPQLIAIATAVREHVQACFDRELALLRAIETGSYSSDMLTEGWPDSLTPPEPEPLEPQ
ncbi:DUF4376 domain-containing protein [Pseudomonas sp. B21-017]|jgi:hypothetical protein|uniref:DUF4376 domain-containing protein n=1 Tax=Pseudomonas TaxID=286 RepID=UPI00037D1987|nr:MULTISPECIES: DUF4376 domain-containing protein [Pseudomonas]UVM37696.1 DUF4376 domain-containing protein [Pseudomonas sp. B21-017]